VRLRWDEIITRLSYRFNFFGHTGSDFSNDDQAFAQKIATALKSELKDRNSRAKLVAGWTGANERTVKNWILGRYAPSGRHLVTLAQHSDQVLSTILIMAGRKNLLIARKIDDLRQKVFELADVMGKSDGYYWARWREVSPLGK
jgi:hypothetical protein